MLTNPERFKAWQIVRVRTRGWFPDVSRGSAWQQAARIYRDRAINLVYTLAGFQRDIHTWEDAYSLLEERMRVARAYLEYVDNYTDIAKMSTEQRQLYDAAWDAIGESDEAT